MSISRAVVSELPLQRIPALAVKVLGRDRIVHEKLAEQAAGLCGVGGIIQEVEGEGPRPWPRESTIYGSHPQSDRLVVSRETIYYGTISQHRSKG